MDPGYGGGAAGNSWGFAPNSNGNIWRAGWIDSTSITHDHTYSFAVNSAACGGILGGVPAFTTAYTGKTTLSDLRIILNSPEFNSEVQHLTV
jgi:hypothetical protein